MKFERHCISLLQFTSRIYWKWKWGLVSHFFIHISIAKGTKKGEAPSAARKGGGRRMSSCNTKSRIRTGTKQDKPTRTSAKAKGVSCSCRQLCKNFRGLKLHQIKAKCQATENKLTGPDKRCFVSLTDTLNTSFLKSGDTIYCKTPSNTFVPTCNSDKPISATQCFVGTNDIVIDPFPEYFNDNISPCDSNACLTCNSFISDQSFKSNLTGRIYKTQTYEQFTCGSSNVVYTGFDVVQCMLVKLGDVCSHGYMGIEQALLEMAKVCFINIFVCLDIQLLT